MPKLPPGCSRDENGTVHLGWVEWLIQGLIILSLIAFSLETLPDLSHEHRLWLEGFELVSVILFTCEYVARLVYSRPFRRYPTSFFGLIDLLSILPYFLSLGFDLRSIRAFRFLRLFRVFKLARYSKAMRRFHRAFIIAKEELILFTTTACILMYLAAVGIYYFEHPAQPDKFRSMFDSLWWAVATLTTVGYGDIYPITFGGRIFTFVVLLGGLGVIAVPTGLVASALSKARREEEEAARSVDSAAEED